MKYQTFKTAYEICFRYGEIVNINLVRDKQSGKSKGYAFLCYEDQRSTVLSVDNLNGIKVNSRIVKIVMHLAECLLGINLSGVCLVVIFLGSNTEVSVTLYYQSYRKQHVCSSSIVV